MGTKKIAVAAALIITFVLGVVLGISLNLKNKGPIDINPFSKSCQYNGKIYKEGESFKDADDCNSCGCSNGQVVCTLMYCE